MIRFEHHILGFLVGDIWMPSVEGYKPLHYSITNEQARNIGPRLLRDHVVAAMMDGDFRSVRIADGILATKVIVERNGRTYTRYVERSLSMFPSIADCITDEWAGPTDEEF